MSNVASLIRDLEDSIHHGSNERRVGTLRRVTDLFLRDAAAYRDDHITLFDVVISRLASAIEARAREELAERLADVPNAPLGIIRSLAHDEIMVARPVLERSVRLNDQDLVSVAVGRGNEHMLAIAERVNLSETVTDVLLTHGDQHVAHAVAGNQGARLSDGSLDRLVDRSRADEALQALLVQRIDLAERHLSDLVATAKDTAYKRLAASLPAVNQNAIAKAVASSAVTVAQEVGKAAGPRDYARAQEVIRRRALKAEIGESDIVAFALEGAFEETVCAITHVTRVTIASIERMFAEAEVDLLLILAKSQTWAWSTVKALIKLRGTPAPGTFAHDRAYETYDHLSVQTAQRVLRFLHVREATHGRQGQDEGSGSLAHLRRSDR